MRPLAGAYAREYPLRNRALPASLAAADAQPANVAGETAMGIALTLQEYLDDHHVPYDVMLHKRTHCAFDTARATHVPGERIAKGVVLTLSLIHI